MADQIETVRTYLAACNAADVSAIEECLADPFTHYYLAPNKGSAPTRGRQQLAQKAAKSSQIARSRWSIDCAISDGTRTAIEYAMSWVPPQTGIATRMRGSEWYDFAGDQISEVRSYHQVTATESELDGFPYADRGFGDGARDAADPLVAGEPSDRRLTLIRDYYDACTRADAAALQAMFTDDVVHYFLHPNVGSKPVAGGEHLARYWRKVAGMISARWIVENIIERGDEAVIEWSMYWNAHPDAPRIVTRGAEWYVFDGDQIAEIRSYHKQPEHSSELDGFEYAERGYSTLGNEASTLHPDPA
ncbi:hypothetical protein EK0264_16765 [Epidermidibacterium keratini]|uniref:SnoaL-like domain-containing protein n=1 Tax=Epidermidibacterium keratini TaxID=1891644 RepID=A0A7L4YRT7_9ACTN|nr:nuclear transport factor 2 family protein [Epidermidibacterium keratini]QHC01768.1 hypothetical protein EK0264_16765 [Epidermidibacterium keratini]